MITPTSINFSHLASRLIEVKSVVTRRARLYRPVDYLGRMPDYFNVHDGREIGGETRLYAYENLVLSAGRTFGFGLVPTAPVHGDSTLSGYEPYDFHHYAERDAVEVTHTIERPSFLISRHRAFHNYYHFMFDYLPYLGFLDQVPCAGDPAERQPIAYRDAQQRFHDPVLDLYRAASFPIFPSTAGVHVANCVVASTLHATDAVDFLRAGARAVPRGGKRRLYITRRAAANQTRLVVNEAVVEAILSEYGFETIVAEEIPFLDQVALFKSAEIVCAPHGAGLTNTAFCEPGTPVIEFVLEERFPLGSVFWRLACAAALRYHVMSGVRVPNRWNSSDEGDLMIDPDQLRLMLRQVIANL